MEHSTLLHLTDKGTEELAHRTYRLGIKQRSILLLLNHPQTLDFALQKSVFPKEEVALAVAALIAQGFIATSAPPEAPPAATPAIPEASPTPLADSGDSGLNDDIILSEAKFLLVDFCVDCFGMHAEKIAESIRSAKSVAPLRIVLKELQGLVSVHKPEQAAHLREIVRSINETT